MCGIYGVISDNSVIDEVISGIRFLQHRGQDAGGILTLEERVSKYDEPFFRKRTDGPVDILAKDINSSSAKGKVGIAHTRYKTVGGIQISNAQPLTSLSTGVAIVYNGHIVNDVEIMGALETVPIYSKTENDAERLLKLFVHNFTKEPSKDFRERAFDSAEVIMDKAVGGYSTLMAVKNVGLLAFRDPFSLRPMVMGVKKQDGSTYYAFSSESVALEQNGFKDIKDVKGGQAIIIDKELNVYEKQIKEPKIHNCAFEWIYFANAHSKIEGVEVNHVRYELGKSLAKRYQNLRDQVDIIVPIPKTPYPASVAMSEEWGKPLKLLIDKYDFAGRIFLKPDQSLRENRASSDFLYYGDAFKDKRIALIDDSIVRGTNSIEIIKNIRNFGAKEVHFFSTYPPFTHRCTYGIDTPLDERLIAHNRSVEEIREKLGLDTLNYSTIDDLKSAIGKDSLCMACIDGNYPTSGMERKVTL